MTRIALITAFPPGLGSLNEYGYHLANAIADRPDVHELVIIADKLQGVLPELKLSPKIRILRTWQFNSSISAIKIARAVRNSKVDGAIFNLQTASFGDSEIPAALGLCAPALTRFLGVPTGVIAHNIVDAVDLTKTAIGKSPLRRMFVMAGGSMATRALLMSNYLTVTLDSFADTLARKYKSSNVYMVPHGSFPSEVCEIRPVEMRPRRIVTLGKFGTYKRLERLIAAFSEARRELAQPNLELVIGGTDHPAAQGYLESVAQLIKPEQNIIFKGYVAESDIPAFFGDAALAVFDYETTTGSSGVLHQAAGFGTPPAYPLIGDFIDVTHREGMRGFHYKALDQAALKNSIIEAMNNCGLANEVAEANLELSAGMPISTVAAFHIELLKKHRPKRIYRLRYLEQ